MKTSLCRISSQHYSTVDYLPGSINNTLTGGTDVLSEQAYEYSEIISFIKNWMLIKKTR